MTEVERQRVIRYMRNDIKYRARTKAPKRSRKHVVNHWCSVFEKAHLPELYIAQACKKAGLMSTFHSVQAYREFKD